VSVTSVLILGAHKDIEHVATAAVLLDPGAGEPTPLQRDTVTTFPLIAYPTTSPAMRRRPRALRRLAVRLRVATHHETLDVELALGADPRGRRDLALRADQLERMRHRRSLARTLRRIVAEAACPPSVARAHPVPIHRSQVRTDAADLIALADRLVFPQPASSVAGIAIAQRLVTDGLTSPLYNACEPHTLRRLARHALAELGAMD